MENNKELSTHQKGDYAEYLAITWLLKQGYEVFKNISHFGMADLIAKKDQEILQIDVKTLQKREVKHNQKESVDGFLFSWKSYLSEEQIRAGIRPLFVLDEQIGWNRDYFTCQ